MSDMIYKNHNCWIEIGFASWMLLQRFNAANVGQININEFFLFSFSLRIALYKHMEIPNFLKSDEKCNFWFFVTCKCFS